jgi:osmoprotectant transport system substrate-binding protein
MKPRGLAIAACLAAALAGCGSSASGGDLKAKGPGAGKPPVTLATKNFTEQFILGQLYKQALAAKGFSVRLKEDVGSSELVDRALVRHSIDFYPEYVSVIVDELAREPNRPGSAQEAYRRAKAFQRKRGFELLAPSPGFDALANAVKPSYARRHGLKTTGDLRKLRSFRYGGPPENITRLAGSRGLRQVYGVHRFEDVPLEGTSARYAALDHGRVEVTQVFSTEGQLAERDRYLVLTDPKGLYGFQHIAPVVDRSVLREQGPAFRRTLDAVDALLTNGALQAMNGAVDLRGESPAVVAHRFLNRHKLV